MRGAAAWPQPAERFLFELCCKILFEEALQRAAAGLLHEYMGQKRRKCPKKRVSSLLQPHSRRALPGSTARVSAALPGTQGVRLTDQTE